MSHKRNGPMNIQRSGAVNPFRPTNGADVGQYNGIGSQNGLCPSGHGTIPRQADQKDRKTSRHTQILTANDTLFSWLLFGKNNSDILMLRFHTSQAHRSSFEPERMQANLSAPPPGQIADCEAPGHKKGPARHRRAYQKDNLVRYHGTACRTGIKALARMRIRTGGEVCELQRRPSTFRFHAVLSALRSAFPDNRPDCWRQWIGQLPSLRPHCCTIRQTQVW